MKVFIIISVILLILSGVAFLVYLMLEKRYRKHKNYERGLKMVTLLIHLPPPSEDIDAANRDKRDVNEESISKAQTIYSIISSTFKKGFLNNFYGQRHFSFEIVGEKGFINFYAVVPLSLTDSVKQGIVSSYPTAIVEEVSDYNIFNQVGKLNGVVGGEFELKDNYAFPIATYQDIKQDPMQVILNAFSGMSNEDGVAIQILIRPADKSWNKSASKVASAKRKGKKINPSIFDGLTNFLRDLILAFVRHPDEGGGQGKEKKELSSMEQSTVDAIDAKTQSPGFETLIRIVASSNINTRSQSILNQVVSSFALFDLPGKNGFKFNRSKQVDELVSDYILRIFPQTKKNMILNSIELATLFHFPEQNNIPTSQLNKQASKQVDGPRNMPEDGILLGYNVFRGAKKPIRLSKSDRERHLYTVGQTGTGKSVFLINLALQDMINGNGFAFVDPHGDAVEELLSMVPKDRIEDVIYFTPSDLEYPIGLNLFDVENPDQKDLIIQECINMIYKIYDPQHQGIVGPRFEQIFRNAALLLMADPNGGTFIDIPKILVDPEFMKSKLQYIKDQNLLDYWTKEWPASQRSSDFGEVVAWVNSKFGAFLGNEMMRNMIGQTKSSLNIRDIMDQGKILLVNLSKGSLGELNSKLLGMLFVMKFQAAAMSRVDIPESERRSFCLYVDEFQNFSTDSLADIMSEARKFKLNLIVANQFTTQLSDTIRDAVFGNIGTIVSFRIGQNDAETVGKYFQPIFDTEDLLRVPNFNTIVRTLVNGVPTQPFTMATLPILGEPNTQLRDALKQLSRGKYGRPRAEVERDIFERLKTNTPAPTSNLNSSFGSTQNSNLPGSGFSGNAKVNKPNPQASFLDDWLAKRKKMTPPSTPSSNPVNSSVKSQDSPEEAGVPSEITKPDSPISPKQNKPEVYVDNEGGVNYKINRED